MLQTQKYTDTIRSSSTKIRANVSLCMFSIEIQKAGWIEMKFVKEVVLVGGKVLGGFYPVPPIHSLRYRVHKSGTGASGASGVHFVKNSLKQKLLGTPNLVGVVHLFGPCPDLAGPCVLLELWCLTFKESL